MDHSYTFTDQVAPARAAQRQGPARADRRLSTAIALAAAGVLAITPIAVMAIVPSDVQVTEEIVANTPPDAALIAFKGRVVELDGAIMQFSQTGNTINLNLMATDDGQRVFVQAPNGALFEVAVSPGQTHVSAELPAHFTASDTLTVRID